MHIITHFIQAYKLGYTYPRYTFLTIAWYAQRWWTLEPEKYGCTAMEFEEVLEYSLSLLHLPYAKFLDQERETDTELVRRGREEKEGGQAEGG